VVVVVSANQYTSSKVICRWGSHGPIRNHLWCSTHQSVPRIAKCSYVLKSPQLLRSQYMRRIPSTLKHPLRCSSRNKARSWSMVRSLVSGSRGGKFAPLTRNIWYWNESALSSKKRRWSKVIVDLLAQLRDLIALQHYEIGFSAFDHAKEKKWRIRALFYFPAITYLCQKIKHQQQTVSLALPVGLCRTISTIVGGI